MHFLLLFFLIIFLSTSAATSHEPLSLNLDSFKPINRVTQEPSVGVYMPDELKKFTSSDDTKDLLKDKKSDNNKKYSKKQNNLSWAQETEQRQTKIKRQKKILWLLLTVTISCTIIILAKKYYDASLLSKKLEFEQQLLRNEVHALTQSVQQHEQFFTSIQQVESHLITAEEQLREHEQLLQRLQQTDTLLNQQLSESSQNFSELQRNLVRQQALYEEHLKASQENCAQQAQLLERYLQQQQQALQQASTTEPMRLSSFIFENLSWSTVSQAARTASDISQAATGLSRAATTLTNILPSDHSERANVEYIQEDRRLHFPRVPQQEPS